jgi:hypothetical protein
VSQELTMAGISQGNSHYIITLETVVQGRTIARAASRRLPTAAARFQPGSGHVGFVVDRVARGQVFSEHFAFPCH